MAVSILPRPEYGPNDNRENRLHFTLFQNLSFDGIAFSYRSDIEKHHSFSKLKIYSVKIDLKHSRISCPHILNQFMSHFNSK